jgi:hypothetical protein
MGEHETVKKFLWVALVLLIVLVLSLFITSKWQQTKMVNPAQPVGTVGAPSSGASGGQVVTPEDKANTEAWEKEQQDAYAAYAKANPVYVIGGTVVSVSETGFEMDIAENLRYPVTGKHTITVAKEDVSIEKATCTGSEGVSSVGQSCTTETIALTDLKDGDKLIVSLDMEAFKKEGKLAAKAILVQ